MPRPTAPLTQTLLAIAERPTSPVDVLERIADRLAVLDNADQICQALVANPALPLPTARRISGVEQTGSLATDGNFLTAFITRPDISDDDLLAVVRWLPAAKSSTVSGPLNELMTNPGTPARVLEALAENLPGRGYDYFRLAAHPNASAATVITVFEALALKAGRNVKTNNAACMSPGLWTGLLRELSADNAGAAFDHLEHPELLGDLAAAWPNLMTESRMDRLAQYAVISPAAWPARLGGAGATKTHPLTRTVALLRDHGSLAVRTRCGDTLDAAGVKITGLDPRTALGLPVEGTRATAAVGGRKFSAIAQTLNTRPDLVDALASEIADLNDSQWEVFCRVADGFTGSVDGLIDTCHGIAS